MPAIGQRLKNANTKTHIQTTPILFIVLAVELNGIAVIAVFSSLIVVVAKWLECLFVPAGIIEPSKEKRNPWGANPPCHDQPFAGTLREINHADKE